MSPTRDLIHLAIEVEDRARQLSLLVDFVNFNRDPAEPECNFAGMIRWQVQDLFDRINVLTEQMETAHTDLYETVHQSPAATNKDAA